MQLARVFVTWSRIEVKSAGTRSKNGDHVTHRWYTRQSRSHRNGISCSSCEDPQLTAFIGRLCHSRRAHVVPDEARSLSPFRSSIPRDVLMRKKTTISARWDLQAVSLYSIMLNYALKHERWLETSGVVIHAARRKSEEREAVSSIHCIFGERFLSFQAICGHGS